MIAREVPSTSSHVISGIYLNTGNVSEAVALTPDEAAAALKEAQADETVITRTYSFVSGGAFCSAIGARDAVMQQTQGLLPHSLPTARLIVMPMLQASSLR